MGTVETFKDKAVAEFGVIVGQVSAHPKTAAFVGLLGWALLALKVFL